MVFTFVMNTRWDPFTIHYYNPETKKGPLRALWRMCSVCTSVFVRHSKQTHRQSRWAGEGARSAGKHGEIAQRDSPLPLCTERPSPDNRVSKLGPRPRAKLPQLRPKTATETNMYPCMSKVMIH